MPGRVPEHVIQQIADSADIVRLIGQYTKLKKRGQRFVGLCPFHKEKTPSFSVDPQQGLYFCFGCKEGGNVFTFLEKTEGMGFYEALQYLAQEAGIDLSRYQSQEGPSRGELQGLRNICELAATFYSKCLQKARGSEHARSYLEGRQINEASVERWRIGYAPEGWENLLQLAQKRSISPSALESAGLAVPRSRGEGHYDRFRNRLMFPVRDRRGRPIGFGARALSEEDEPKYLNSPEGPVFSKGRCFYGFSEAREAIRTEDRAVIVEGYTDVIMAHQHGIATTMAVLGTALTEHHARTLSSLCETVILVFDADEAGQRSAARSIEVLLGEDVETRVAGLEPGTDPCEFLLSRGADSFLERLERSENFLDYRLRRAAETHELGTVDGRTRAFDELARMALGIKNEAKRDMVVRTVAGQLGISERSAFAYLERAWAGSGPHSSASAGGEDAAQQEGLSAPHAVTRELLGLLLTEPSLQRRACEEIEASALAEGTDRRLLEKLLEESRRRGEIEAGRFVNSLQEQDLIERASSAIAEEQRKRTCMSHRPPETRYKACREHLRGEQLKQQKRDLLDSIAQGEQTRQSTEPADEDERLRAYLQLRRQEDRRAARINRRKEAQ